jgi:SAM-dependent methyltransferase
MFEGQSEEIRAQREYYSQTAERYNEVHADAEKRDVHFFALRFMVAALDFLDVESVLDVGSGTGRVSLYVKKVKPGLRVVGVEPVRRLRQIGHENGLAEGELIDGDATNLQFDAGEFDLVCAFGVLHHIKKPDRAVAEMLRVAGRAVFISDSNNFGQGSRIARGMKQLINLAGLWKAADLLKTRGKGYSISVGDGLSYSYSVFNNYKQIRRQCKKIHLLNTTDGRINPYRSASHVALLGVK